MYTALLVEDEATVREGIVRRIDWESHGFTLMGACEDGAQAFAMLQETPVDVIITDINMPIMDGLTLAEKVQQRWPDTIVVILTGFSEFSYAQKAIRCHVHEYILKPITARQLRELLDKLREELDVRNKPLQEKTVFLASADEARNLIVEQFFQRFLLGELEKEDFLKGVQDFGLSFQEGAGFAILVDIAAIPRETSPAKQLLAAQLKNEFALLPAELVVDKEGRFVVLCTGSLTPDAVEEKLQKIAEKLGFPLFVTMGGAASRWDELSTSYQQAAYAWEYFYVQPEKRVLRYQDVPASAVEKISFRELRRALIAQVKLQNEAQTKQELHNFLQKLTQNQLCKKEMIHQLNKLVIQLGEAAEQQSLYTPDHAQDIVLLALEKSENVYEADTILRAYLLEFIQKSKMQGDSGTRQASLALQYMQEHYSSPTLSLQQITAFLSVSTSYFSGLFKAQTGLTFVEYLTRMRIQKAQELLLTTDLKNYEIAGRVGYEDPGYFGATFKKITGVGCADYRRQHKSEGKGHGQA